ncbi:MAG: hypothetical protein ACTSV2_14410 [Candidatus Thorarchaeota archaeon]
MKNALKLLELKGEQSLDCDGFDHCASIREAIESSEEEPVKGRFTLDYGIRYNRDRQDCNLDSFVTYRKHERPYSYEHPKYYEEKYRILFAGMNLVDAARPIIPHLHVLFDSMQSYLYLSSTGLLTEVKPSQICFRSYLDLNPNTVTISLIKTYVEVQHAHEIRELCGKIDTICESVVQEIWTNGLTPWQIVDRMRITLLTKIVKSFLDNESVTMLRLKSHRDQNLPICFQERDIDALIGDILVLDLKSNKISKASEVAENKTGNDITIVNVTFDQHSYSISKKPKEIVDIIKQGVRKTLGGRFRFPEALLVINGGDVLPATLTWYYTQKGFDNVALVETEPYWSHFSLGLDELKTGDALRQPLP